MFLPNHTGFRKHQLRGDQGLFPTWAENSQVRFDLRSLPILTAGNLANYLYGIVLTFVGNVNTTLTASSFFTMTELYQVLISNIQMVGAWHGKPLSSDHIRGATLPLIEFVSLGYRYWSNRRRAIDGNTTAAHPVEISIFVPLGTYLGRKPHHNAQLALFYRDAFLDINTGANATFNTLPGQATPMNAATTFTGNVRATALLIPDRELRVGPATEWVEYVETSPAGVGTDEIQLDSFGNKTGLSGVESGAGIAWAAGLCNAETQFGSYALTDVTQIEIPWRSQSQTQHINPFIDEANAMRDAHRVLFPVGLDTAAADQTTVHDARGYPYTDRDIGTNPRGTAAAGLGTARILPLLTGGPELMSSKIQVVEGTQSYSVSVTGTGFVNSAGRQHRTLVNQWKSWTPEKWADARDQIIRSGLANAVEGTDNLVWSTKFSEKNQIGVNTSKVRFLPQRLRPPMGATPPTG
jgi:hypothetical protein